MLQSMRTVRTKCKSAFRTNTNVRVCETFRLVKAITMCYIITRKRNIQKGNTQTGKPNNEFQEFNEKRTSDGNSLNRKYRKTKI